MSCVLTPTWGCHERCSLSPTWGCHERCSLSYFSHLFVWLQEFSSKGWDPKVQVPFKVDSGRTPRKLEIERRKRHYAKLSLEELLKEKGVDSQDLMPVVVQPSRLSNSVVHKRATFSPFLPLEIFDNVDFDIRTPDEWVALGEYVVGPMRGRVGTRREMFMGEANPEAGGCTGVWFTLHPYPQVMMAKGGESLFQQRPCYL